MGGNLGSGSNNPNPTTRRIKQNNQRGGGGSGGGTRHVGGGGSGGGSRGTNQSTTSHTHLGNVPSQHSNGRMTRSGTANDRAAISNIARQERERDEAQQLADLRRQDERRRNGTTNSDYGVGY